jgi:hypothetical protein
MDEEVVREHARAMADALVVGDVDHAISDFSDELRRNVGEVLSLLPLPSTAAEIESVERGASVFIVILHRFGESSEDRIQTRWKDRDDQPTVVEVSHLSRTELAADEAPEVVEGETSTGTETATE